VIPCAYKKPKVVRPWFQFLKKVLEISVQTAGLEKTQKVLPPNYVKECLNKIFSHEIKNDEEKEGDKKVREKTPQHKKLLDCATLLSTKHFLEIFAETGKPPQNPKKRAREGEGDGTVDSPTSKKQKVSHSPGETEHTLDTAETKANAAAAKKAVAEKRKKKKDKRAELQQRKREKKIRKAVKRGKPIPPEPIKPKKNKMKYEKNKERNRLRKIEAKKKFQDKH